MQRTNQSSTFRFLIITGILAIFLTGSVFAMPPHPSMLEKAEQAQKSVPYYLVNLDEMHSKGICSGEKIFNKVIKDAKDAVGYNSAVSGTFNVLAILVDFSDNTAVVPTTDFDSVLFDSNGITVKNYYSDISYGSLDLVTLDLPSSLGWNRAPQTYAYYANNANGVGSYPQNSQKLVEDLVDAVDGAVDFSSYDNDNNSFVDVLIVMHAGQGAEVSGLNSDIWSHKWGISPKMTNDGVYVSSYTIQPEYISTPGDLTIGVISHELAHGFGLPDLYDTDYSSNGIGRWGIMAFGSWLGPSNKGGRPAAPCAWSRLEMGFNTATNVSSNVNGQVINDVKSSGQIFRLWTSGNMGNEYFLIENRQKTGYDTYLPGSGLLVWHIDDGKTSNDDEWYPSLSTSNHYMVALEQADGLYELEHANDYGDANDIFPGNLNVSDFNALSSTNSDSYSSGGSFVAVENIATNSGVITADLIVALSAGIDDEETDILPQEYSLAQNYPNPFNPTTTIEYYLPNSGEVEIEVYNITGQKVKTLVDGNATVGTNSIDWDGTDEYGYEVASGMYFYRLNAPSFSMTKKMTLLR